MGTIFSSEIKEQTNKSSPRKRKSRFPKLKGSPHKSNTRIRDVSDADIDEDREVENVEQKDVDKKREKLKIKDLDESEDADHESSEDEDEDEDVSGSCSSEDFDSTQEDGEEKDEEEESDFLIELQENVADPLLGFPVEEIDKKKAGQVYLLVYKGVDCSSLQSSKDSNNNQDEEKKSNKKPKKGRSDLESINTADYSECKFHYSVLIDIQGESDDLHLIGLEMHLGVKANNNPSNNLTNGDINEEKKTLFLANRRVVDRDRLTGVHPLKKIEPGNDVDSFQWRSDLEREGYTIYKKWISSEGDKWSDKVNCKKYAERLCSKVFEVDISHSKHQHLDH